MRLRVSRAARAKRKRNRVDSVRVPSAGPYPRFGPGVRDHAHRHAPRVPSRWRPDRGVWHAMTIAPSEERGLSRTYCFQLRRIRRLSLVTDWYTRSRSGSRALHFAVLWPISAVLVPRQVGRYGMVDKGSPMVAEICSASGVGLEGTTWRLPVRLQRRIEQGRWVSAEERISDELFGDCINVWPCMVESVRFLVARPPGVSCGRPAGQGRSRQRPVRMDRRAPLQADPARIHRSR